MAAVLATSVVIVVSPVGAFAVDPDIGGAPIHTEEDYFSAGDWGVTVRSYVYDNTSTSIPSIYPGFALNPGEMLFLYLLDCDSAKSTSVDHFAIGNPELLSISAVGWTTDVVPVGYDVGNHQDPYLYGFSGPAEATIFTYTGNFMDPWSTLDPGEYSLVYYIAVSEDYGPVSATADGGGEGENQLLPGPRIMEATLSLQAPNGDEVLTGGTNYGITWATEGTVEDVLIEYSTNNGGTWSDVNTVPNIGSYDWLLPVVSSNQCLVRISDSSNPDVFDTSDDVFTIRLGTVYVDDDARGANNGSSWTDAYNYLQDALAVAQSGHEIWVAQGTYTPDSNSIYPNGTGDREATFQLKNGVGIYGGFGGGETNLDQRDWETHETILSGDLLNPAINSDNTYHVVTGSNNSTIDGFTIKGGNANGNSEEEKCGGGMYQNAGSLTVTNCTFSENSAVGGGGLGIHEDTPVLNNCIFMGNEAMFGGGVYAFDSITLLMNCTFYNNSVTGPYGGGALYSLVDSNVSLVNSILWNNNNEIGLSPLGHSTVTVCYCNVQGGTEEVSLGAGTLNWGDGNIDAAPCFVDAGYWDANGTPDDVNDDLWVDGDYHLRSQGWRWVEPEGDWTWDDVTSRCIDAGNPAAALGGELLTIPRDPNNLWGKNLRINMGAYGGTAEASMPPHNWALLADISNDGVVDLADLGQQVEGWLADIIDNPSDLHRAGDLNRDAIVDMRDYALLANDWVKTTSWY